MTTERSVFFAVVAVICAILTAATFPRMADRDSPVQPVEAAENDIAGVVTGRNGPEAGVWVIAETSELPTKYVKIVVTDDRGRYVIPELPKASYSVWVRGYGLVDSPKRRAAPGTTLNLTAVAAPNARAASEYYPAGLLVLPDAHSGQERVSGHGAGWKRHLRRT